MSFMDSLSANPSGSVYGQPNQQNQPDVLGIVNNLKDREFRDYQNKANFMSDLSIKQDRMRRLYGLDSPPQNQNQGGPQQSSGETPPVRDPNAITGAQQAELGIKQQGMNLESQRLAQQNKMGEERLGIQSAQEKLNQQKSDSIHEQKVNELQTKQDEYKQKMDLANKALTDKNSNLESQLQAHKDLAENTKAYHDADQKLRELNFNRTHDQMQQKIDQMGEQIKQKGTSQTQTDVNPEGTSRVTTTRRGSAAQNVIKTNPDKTLHVTGPKTKDNPQGEYDIPADKLDHWNSTVMSGGDQSTQPSGKEEE